MTINTRKDAIEAAVRYGVPYSDPPHRRLADQIEAQLTLDAPAPAAKTGDATLTIAELLAGLITVTKATAVAITLPLGTLTDAGVLSGALAVDQGFAWSLINLGSSSGAVTMTEDTDHTYVGNATVAISTSARFLTRKTATETFVTYRIS